MTVLALSHDPTSDVKNIRTCYRQYLLCHLQETQITTRNYEVNSYIYIVNQL